MAVIKTKTCSACGEEIDYNWGKAPQQCPACGAHYWDKPEDERILFGLQDEFSRTHSSEVLGKIYHHLNFYATNVIKGLLRNKHILQSYELEERASDIANKIMEKYLKDYNFKIDWSFGALLKKIALGVLYGGQREDNHISLNAPVMDGSEEIEENLEYQGFDPLVQHTTDVEQEFFTKEDSSVMEAYSLIEAIYDRIRNTERNRMIPLLYLIAMKNRLYNDQPQFMEKFFDFAGLAVKDDVRKTEMVLRNYLQEAARNA